MTCHGLEGLENDRTVPARNHAPDVARLDGRHLWLRGKIYLERAVGVRLDHIGIEALGVGAIGHAARQGRINDHAPAFAEIYGIRINVICVRRRGVARVHRELDGQFLRHIVAGVKIMRHHALREWQRVVIHGEALHHDV